MATTSTLTGTLNNNGTTDEVFVTRRRYNMSVWGTFNATVELQRSFDDGATWLIAKTVTDGFEGVGVESESKVLYRFEVSNYSSGVINYRLGLTIL